MGIPDHLTCLLRNLYAGQEATVRTGHGTDWFQTGKNIKKRHSINKGSNRTLTNKSLTEFTVCWIYISRFWGQEFITGDLKNISMKLIISR